MDNAAIRENFASSIYDMGVSAAKDEILNILPKYLADMHKSGDIHIHDLESFGCVYNCCTPDLYAFLSKQRYDAQNEEGAILEIFEYIKLLITGLANCQAGGIGFGNFDIDVGNILETIGVVENERNVTTLNKCLELFIAWINCTRTRFCREPYYITLNIGLADSSWGRLICHNLLDVFYNAPNTFIKPNIVFKVSSKQNATIGSKNYDIFEKALACTAKRMVPTYLLMDSNCNESCDAYKLSIMGCRTRVYDNLNGNPGTIGRGNIAYVSINLPRIALTTRGENEFYHRLQNTMQSCVELLRIRRDRLIKSSGKYLSFVLEQSIWNGVLTMNDMALSGTYSIGFIGLAETVEVLTGKKFYNDESAYKIAKDIVKFMNDFVMSIRKSEHMNYSLLATPGEMLSGRFCDIDRKMYPHLIQEKGFYTNSFHVEVDSMISLFRKIELEGFFHKLCNGGAITYIELPSAVLDNTEALNDAIIYSLKSGISYLGFNFPLDICNECGIAGTFDACPNCESKSITRIRRVSGYLENVDFFTDGKRAEVKRRKPNI